MSRVRQLLPVVIRTLCGLLVNVLSRLIERGTLLRFRYVKLSRLNEYTRQKREGVVVYMIVKKIFICNCTYVL